jgi:hypothetical protein
MKKLVTLSLAAMLLSSTAVLAQDALTFENLDSDGDDQLSYSDLVSAWPDLTQEQFDSADIDNDDFLDATQFEALQGSMSSGASTEVAVSGSMGSSVVDAPLFEDIDKDGNDKISFDDLNGWGISQEQFDAADIDNDDFLDATQYEGIKGLLMAPEADANVALGMASSSSGDMRLFEDVDADGDGQVAFSDLTDLGITQEQFDAADIDNDDFLDRTQYESLNS